MIGLGSGRLTLAARYGWASAVVLVTASAVISHYVSNMTVERILENTAADTAIFMDSILSPITYDLADDGDLGLGARQALQEIFWNSKVAENVVSFRIWGPDGKIAEASDHTLIGRVMPVSPEQRKAWQGGITASFLAYGHPFLDEGYGLPVLEIFSPIRASYSGEVVAVIEFIEYREDLLQTLQQSRRSSWLMVVGVITALGLLLFLIVLKGSQTIEHQYQELSKRAQTEESHHEQLRQATRRSAVISEISMRRLGADLHDGPAQLMAYAALKLDGIRDLLGPSASMSEVDSIGDAIAAAMQEIRAVSRGLSMPELDGQPASVAVSRSVAEHEVRTGNHVKLKSDCHHDPVLPNAVNICLYRFVQEGLNNAAKHAHPEGNEVQVTCKRDVLTLKIRDKGPGIPQKRSGQGLGLEGLRHRVESLGGFFQPGRGLDGHGELMMRYKMGEIT